MAVKVKVVAKMGASALVILCVCLGCAPYVATQQSNEIILPPAAEKNIFIENDPRETDLVLIKKPLEGILASKGYKVVDAAEKAAYKMRLHLIYFGLKNHATSLAARSDGSLTHIGLTAGALASSSVAGAAGFGAASLLFGGSSGVPFDDKFVGKMNVSISSQSITEQETTLYAEAKVHHEKKVHSAQEAVADTLAKKIAALMP